mgnify:CR=1 FL=1
MNKAPGSGFLLAGGFVMYVFFYNDIHILNYLHASYRTIEH